MDNSVAEHTIEPVSSPPSDSKKKKKKKGKGSSVISVIGTILGLLILAYPWVTDLYARYLANDQVETHSAQVASMKEDERDLYLEQARAYNDLIAGNMHAFDKHPDFPREYDDVLSYDVRGIIGSVEIPRLSIKQPIYKGTSDAVLMAGVGHLENTSFPIDGESVHAIISGHSGMPMQRMFDQLINIQEGDIVKVTIVDEITYYKMTDYDIVLPEYAEFNVERGVNKLTLVTCTPYGVNDHRLLVHCVKTDYSEIKDGPIPADNLIQNYLDLRTVPFLVGFILTIAGVIFFKVRKRRRDKKKQASGEKKNGDSLNELSCVEPTGLPVG